MCCFDILPNSILCSLTKIGCLSSKWLTNACSSRINELYKIRDEKLALIPTNLRSMYFTLFDWLIKLELSYADPINIWDVKFSILEIQVNALETQENLNLYLHIIDIKLCTLISNNSVQLGEEMQMVNNWIDKCKDINDRLSMLLSLLVKIVYKFKNEKSIKLKISNELKLLDESIV